MRKLGLFGFSAALLLGACGVEVGEDVAVSKDAAVTHDTFTAMLSNTMSVVTPDGTVQDWIFNEDGTVRSLTNITGTWEFDGDILCTLYGEKTTPGCWALPRGKTVGDTWEQDVGSGKILTITIVEGR